jgi:carboxymethylenebutenolidase
MAWPDGAGPWPGVIVIHEAFGLNDNIRDIARRLAGAGYAALAVDLFSGRNQAFCMARIFAGMFLNSFDHAAIHDLRAALDTLQARPEVDAARVGAIGFCMGGGLALAWASTDNRLQAIAPFYGMNPRPLEGIRRACPVVGSYPAQDFTAGQGRKLAATLADARVPHDIKIYGKAKHSFFNDTLPTYDSTASADAWARTLAFFRARLG